MRRSSPGPGFFAASLLLAAAAWAGEPPQVLVGDVAHGESLYRLHCSQCHGADRTGSGYLSKTLKDPKPRNLQDPGFLMRRTDHDLLTVVTLGGKAVGAHFTMPEFGGHLGILDAWDVIAYLRHDQFKVEHFFPGASKFVAKEHALDDPAIARIEAVGGSLSDAERAITLVAVYGGKDRPRSPEYVPLTPKDLATVANRPLLGYLAFGEVSLRAGSRPAVVGLALDRDGVIQKILVRTEPGRVPSEHEGLDAFRGQGGRRHSQLPAYPLLGSDSVRDTRLAAQVSRAYYRALEALLVEAD